jgi:hypothetical protein
VPNVDFTKKNTLPSVEGTLYNKKTTRMCFLSANITHTSGFLGQENHECETPKNTREPFSVYHMTQVRAF